MQSAVKSPLMAVMEVNRQRIKTTPTIIFPQSYVFYQQQFARKERENIDFGWFRGSCVCSVHWLRRHLRKLPWIWCELIRPMAFFKSHSSELTISYFPTRVFFSQHFCWKELFFCARCLEQKIKLDYVPALVTEISQEKCSLLVFQSLLFNFFCTLLSSCWPIFLYFHIIAIVDT